VPLGAYLIRHLDAEIFRRICMSFDVLIVSFGLARVLQELKLLPGPETYLVMAATAALDGFLLVRFFAGRRGLARAGAGARG
jgi:mannitol-specific phosphotransferase system IIBC component